MRRRRPGVFFGENSTGTRLVIKTGGTACDVVSYGATLVDSVCSSTSSSAAGAGNFLATATGNPMTFRNDTLIGASNGLDLEAPTVAQTVRLINTIVYTTSTSPTSCSIHMPMGATGAITLSTDSSNFPTITAACSGTPGTLVLQPNGGDQNSTPPIFVDVTNGDYHEASDSPTRNGGDYGAIPPGDLDLDRKQRTILQTTDIGAYEFLPAPDVTPLPPDLTATSATVHLSVNNHRLDSGTLPQWGLVTSDENFAPTSISLTGEEGDQQVDYQITGLQPNTTYLWSACTLTNGGNNCLPDQSFKTRPLPPVVINPLADAVTATGATLHATVNPNDGATTVHFEYGQDATYGSSTTPDPVPAGHTGAPVSAAITGLQPGTTYHARAVAVSAGGTVNSSDFTFTTKAAAPVITGIPTISGSPIVGQTLTCTPPTFASPGDPSPKTTLAWLRDGTSVAAGATYHLTADDSGRQLACRFTVTNSAGSTAASSASVMPTAPPGHQNPTITLGSNSVRIATKTRSGNVAASCAGASGATCTVTGQLFGPGNLPAVAAANRRPKTAVQLGTVSGSIRVGQSGTLTIKLTRKGLHRLRKRHHLRARLVGRVSDGAGGVSQVLAGLKLTSARPK